MPIRLVLADCDLGYVEKLSAWIHKNLPFQFQIEVLTKPQSLQAWLDSSGKADLILISPLLYASLPFPDSIPIMLLDDGTSHSITQEVPRLSKYQQASELTKEILAACADRMPQIRNRPKHAYKLTIVSYLDGDSLNPIAPAIAVAIAQKGRRVLYISLEQNQTTELYFQSGNPKGLVELIYYIKTNKDNLSLRLEACSSKDVGSGVDFLKAPAGIFKSEEIGKEEITTLLNAAGQSGYEEIVLSVDFRLEETFHHLMGCAHRIVFSLFNTASSAIKLKKFLDELRKNQSDQKDTFVKARVLLTKLVEESYFDDTPLKKLFIYPVPSRPDNWPPAHDYLAVIDSLINDFNG